MWVDLDCILVILDSIVELPLLSVGETAVVIEVGLARLDRNGLRETLDGFIVVAFAVETDALVVVSVRVVWVDFDCLRIVLYCVVELADLVAGEATIEQSLEVIWHDLESASVVLNSSLIVALLARFVAFGVKIICLLFLSNVLVVLLLASPALSITAGLPCRCPLLRSLMILPRCAVVVLQ